MSKTFLRDREFLTQKKSPAKNPTATTTEARVMRKISQGFRDPLGVTSFTGVVAFMPTLLEVVCVPVEESVLEPPVFALDAVLAAVLVPLEVTLDPVLEAALVLLEITLDPGLVAILVPLGVVLDPVLETMLVPLEVVIE